MHDRLQGRQGRHDHQRPVATPTTYKGTAFGKADNLGIAPVPAGSRQGRRPGRRPQPGRLRAARRTWTPLAFVEFMNSRRRPRRSRPRSACCRPAPRPTTTRRSQATRSSPPSSPSWTPRPPGRGSPRAASSFGPLDTDGYRGPGRRPGDPAQDALNDEVDGQSPADPPGTSSPSPGRLPRPDRRETGDDQGHRHRGRPTGARGRTAAAAERSRPASALLRPALVRLGDGRPGRHSSWRADRLPARPGRLPVPHQRHRGHHRPRDRRQPHPGRPTRSVGLDNYIGDPHRRRRPVLGAADLDARSGPSSASSSTIATRPRPGRAAQPQAAVPRRLPGAADPAVGGPGFVSRVRLAVHVQPATSACSTAC